MFPIPAMMDWSIIRRPIGNLLCCIFWKEISGFASVRKMSGPIRVISALTPGWSSTSQIDGPFMSMKCVLQVIRTRTAPFGSSGGNRCFRIRPKSPKWMCSASLFWNLYRRCFPNASTVSQNCASKREAPSENLPCGEETDNFWPSLFISPPTRRTCYHHWVW